MPFFITLSVLAAAAAAYLLYQFRSRAFVADDTPDAQAKPEPSDTTLKAA
jgi:hypothetical protein